MTEPLLIPLTAIRRKDWSQVGGKAAQLGELVAAGFPVPAGVSVTTAAFRLALVDYQATIKAILQEADCRQPAMAQRAATAIAQRLADLAVPTALLSALQTELPRLTDATTLLAVRSSATAEDQAASSYAGQYATVLGVRDMAAVTTAILTCWRSFFSPHALAARATQAALGMAEGMAVLIQPVIAAECAGVAFSVDPVQQRRDLIVINAAWGLGVGVVEGSVATDSFWVQRATVRVERQVIVAKPTQINLDAEGNRQRVDVPVEQQRAACLPPVWVERVAQFAIAAELLYGCPQDLEWAIADDQLWLLQSRPITGLPLAWMQAPAFPVTWEADEDPQALWRCWHERETPAVLLPLELDHLVELESTWEEACRLLGADRKVQFKYCHGRAYTRRVPMPWSAADQRVRRTAIEDLCNRLQGQGLTIWDHWGPEIVKATERLRAFDPAQADGPALADHLAEALAVRRRHYILHPMMNFNPPPAFFAAYAAVAGVGETAATAPASALLDAGETPLSRLTDQLYALAQLAKAEPALVAGLVQPLTDPLPVLAALPQGAPFLTQWQLLLAHYGERMGDGWGSEMTLRRPTWREQPALVLDLLRPWLKADLEPPAVARERARQTRDATVEALCAACPDPALVVEFRHQLAHASKVHAILEIHNHYIDQMSTGQLRQAVMTAARWLVDQGVLASTADAFWLHFGELLTALRQATPATLTATVATRQADFAQWSQVAAPPILGVPAPALPARPPWQDEVTIVADSVTAGHSLTGLGASPGQVRGQAYIMDDPLTLPALPPGAILVAENVGPLWTPLFPLLGGLILEGGAIGQHAAATAREYGIPAVIGVKQARQQIPAGAWLLVDGGEGKIEFVEV